MRFAVITTIVLCLTSAGGRAGEMLDRFSQDFQTQYTPQAMELLGGESPKRYCRLDSGGLRCTIPAGAEEVSFCGISAKFVVKGDFELTGDYKILKLSKPEEGHGAGLKISIKDHRKEWASLQRLRLPDDRQIYSAHRAVMSEDKYEHSSEMTPTSATTGRLRLKRSGTMIHYLVADGDSKEFRELRSVEFTDGDLVQVYFAAQTGESPTTADVVWTNIALQAEELVPTYEEEAKSQFGWQTALAGLVLLLVIVGLVVVRRRAGG